MVHHGENLQKYAKMKGFNKTQIAKMLKKTSQSVDYDFKREVINIENLKKYSDLLGIPLEKIQTDSKETTNSLSMEKMFELMEENRKLWKLVINHGIQIPVNFSLVSGSAIMFVGFFCGFTNITANIVKCLNF